jgi:hypothetical protein
MLISFSGHIITHRVDFNLEVGIVGFLCGAGPHQWEGKILRNKENGNAVGGPQRLCSYDKARQRKAGTKQGQAKAGQDKHSQFLVFLFHLTAASRIQQQRSLWKWMVGGVLVQHRTFSRAATTSWRRAELGGREGEEDSLFMTRRKAHDY